MAVDRLIGILAVLLREERVTAGALADRFEVSVRTIQRDIDRLCRAGIPLCATRGCGGGISIMEGYTVDRTLLTGADRGAILAGLRSLDSVSGTGYYRQLMEKLPQAEMETADDCVVIDLASWYGRFLTPVLEQLKGCCTNRRVVAFTYCAPGGDSRREAEPCKLLFRWSSWYLWAWCRKRQDFRLFKLQRMLDLEETGEIFAPRPVPSPVVPVEQVFAHRYQAVVRFQSSARWRLVDEYGQRCFIEEPEGTLLFRREMPGKEALLHWLLTFGEQAELLEPQEWRADMGLLCKKIWEKYDK